jgi:hypothetical protein
MKKIAIVIALFMLAAGAQQARAGYWMEYYRDNLFGGLAYHRISCLTNFTTIVSSQEYDGFTTQNYCNVGATSNSVPNGQWYDLQSLGTSLSAAASKANTCGARANAKYATPNYAARSTRCTYNILTNCNSDCWIRYYSTCMGHRVATASPCLGYSYP